MSESSLEENISWEIHATLDKCFIFVLIDIASCTHHLLAETNEAASPLLTPGPKT